MAGLWRWLPLQRVPAGVELLVREAWVCGRLQSSGGIAGIVIAGAVILLYWFIKNTIYVVWQSKGALAASRGGGNIAAGCYFFRER